MRVEYVTVNQTLFFFSPVRPEEMDWSKLFNNDENVDQRATGDQARDVEFLDVGCGYGGLLGKRSYFIIICVRKSVMFTYTLHA